MTTARTHTPDVITHGEDGQSVTRTVKLKRACNGCGQLLGDIDDRDVDGHGNLTDVRTECSHCAPLVARATAMTSYRRYHHDPDPNHRGSGRLPSLNQLDASRLARIHFTAYPSLRSIQAETHGAITLLQGNRHIRLEPGPDSRPSLLTQRQAEDLLLIAQVGDRARITVTSAQGTAVDAGLHRIPPAATERLIGHGWIATTGFEGAPVGVSLAGIVALVWRASRVQGVPVGAWADAIAEALRDTFAAPTP
jgi:hypothetical protein